MTVAANLQNTAARQKLLICSIVDRRKLWQRLMVYEYGVKNKR